MRLVEAMLPARGPQALAAWYADTFGRVPVVFEPGETSPQHIAFHVADLGDWRDRLAEPLLQGADGAEEFDFAAWDGARSIYVEDPEGNVVELVARPRPRPEISLAEIGLATRDVGAAIEALDERLGLPLFSGDGSRFAAVGDPDGLLIVVATGRGWFPTGVAAGEAAVAVRLEGGRPGELVLPGSRHRVTCA